MSYFISEDEDKILEYEDDVLTVFNILEDEEEEEEKPEPVKIKKTKSNGKQPNSGQKQIDIRNLLKKEMPVKDVVETLKDKYTISLQDVYQARSAMKKLSGIDKPVISITVDKEPLSLETINQIKERINIGDHPSTISEEFMIPTIEVIKIKNEMDEMEIDTIR